MSVGRAYAVPGPRLQTFQPFGGAAGTDTGWGRGGIREFTDLQTLVVDLKNV